MSSGARIVHVIILGLWAGSVAFYLMLRSRVEAIIPSLHTADALLNDILAQIDSFALIAGPLLLVSLIAGWSPLQTPIRNRALGVLLATVTAGISGRWLAPRKTELIEALGRRIEDADPAAPRVLELVQLDQVGLGLLAVHGIVAVLLIAAAIRASQPRRSFGIEL